jgi:hypothetical protein
VRWSVRGVLLRSSGLVQYGQDWRLEIAIVKRVLWIVKVESIRAGQDEMTRLR